MDFVDDYARQAAQLYLIAQPYLTSTLELLFSAQRYFEILLLPHLSSLAKWAYASPSLLTIVFFVLLLFIMLQILIFVRRLVTFWLRLIFRLTFWAGIVLLLAFLWQKGFESSMAGLESWVREIVRIYRREYERWEGYGNPPQYEMNYGRRIGKSRYMHSFQ